MKRYGIIASLLGGIMGSIITLLVFTHVNDDIQAVDVQAAITQLDNVSQHNPDTNHGGVKNIRTVASAASVATIENEMVDAAKRTVDAVVHVKTAYMQQYSYGNPFLEYFFGNGGQTYQQPVMSSGSGVIVSGDGYIITNNHVIDRAQKIQIVMNDNREYEAQVVGTDPGTDIALLKIDEKDLPFIKAGNSDDVQVGEWVLAVGNPFNLTSTVTSGIVSAKARNINIMRENYGIEAFIQTDAAVNPGNSGGALVNRKGELIGINTAIASKTGSFAGYSFAVPVNIAMKVAEDLMEYGQVQRAVMGIVIHDINTAFAAEAGIDVLNGVYIDKVNPDGAAAEAGIQPGDVVVRIGSVSIKNVAEFQEQLSRFRPGDKLTVTVMRKGRETEKQVLLQNNQGNTAIVKGHNELAALGAQFGEVSDKEKRMLKIRTGLKVVKLSSGKFRDAGIHEGFIILTMNGIKIDDEKDIKNVIADARGGVMVEGIYPNGMKAYYAFGK
ncbi:MAG: trypsin-like peptidase domain-containing protein [Salinivirgaceae bacterium]